MRFPNPWVFAPLNTHTPAQAEAWWAQCFVPTPALEQFALAEYSSAIVGEKGSGRGVALAYLAQATPPATLLLDYNPAHWPSQETALCRGQDHFYQMMGTIIDYFLEGERWVAMREASPFLREFFFWAVKTYLPVWRQRPLRSALGRIDEALGQEFEQAADLYPANPTTYPTQLQELRELLAIWGHSQIYLVCRLHTAAKNDYYDDLKALFGMSSLFEQSFVNLRFVLPNDEKLQQLLVHISGRLSIHRLRYRDNQIETIVNRHLCLATDETITALSQLASAEVLDGIKEDIERLYGYSALAPWLQWAHTLLEAYREHGEPVVALGQVIGRFYGRYVPLQLDEERHGVWQGPRFIPLSIQPLRLLRQLFLAKGKFARDELLEKAGSEDNMYTIIRRLRKELEPPSLPKREYVYLKSDSEGYYLDIQ